MHIAGFVLHQRLIELSKAVLTRPFLRWEQQPVLRGIPGSLTLLLRFLDGCFELRAKTWIGWLGAVVAIHTCDPTFEVLGDAELSHGLELPPGSEHHIRLVDARDRAERGAPVLQCRFHQADGGNAVRSGTLALVSMESPDALEHQ